MRTRNILASRSRLRSFFLNDRFRSRGGRVQYALRLDAGGALNEVNHPQEISDGTQSGRRPGEGAEETTAEGGTALAGETRGRGAGNRDGSAGRKAFREVTFNTRATFRVSLWMLAL
jgi:hypothetical protein